MSALRRIVLATLAGVLVAGCGSGGDRTPSLARLPLVHGLRVTMRVRVCNPGTNAFCAWQVVAVGSGYASSDALRRAETQLLRRRGWHKANAPAGQELAADSPADKLRLTYATALDELQAVAFGYVKRPRRLTRALSHALFARESAMLMVLELGTTS